MRNIHSLIKTRDPILCIYKKITTKQTNKQKTNKRLKKLVSENTIVNI